MISVSPKMLDDCLRRVGECFEVLSGFLRETEDPESLGSPRSPLRAGDEVRGGICEATTSLEPDGAGAKAVHGVGRETQSSKDRRLTCPSDPNNWPRHLAEANSSPASLGNPPSSLAIQLSQNLHCID